MSIHGKAKRITTQVLQEMKNNGEKIAMLTAYDYSMARIVDAAGVDIILVGDSASNVMAGHETTLPITLDHMIYHAQGVVRAAKKALVVVDLRRRLRRWLPRQKEKTARLHKQGVRSCRDGLFCGIFFLSASLFSPYCHSTRPSLVPCPPRCV